MSEIVEFLKARLDEDEQIARTSIGSHPELAEWSYEPWSPGVKGSGEVIAPNDRDSSGYPEYITCDREGVIHAVEEHVGPHIARHDPARVLREVKAKRRVIDQIDKLDGWTDNYQFHLEYTSVIGHLASAYSDHPDYPGERMTR